MSSYDLRSRLELLRRFDEAQARLFNGAGMQYGMGMLSSYDYLFFKQGNEENTPYNTVDETKARKWLFSLPALIHGRDAIP